MDAVKEVDFDGIVESLNQFGLYQVRHFVLTAILVILASSHSSNYIFIGADVNYRCQIEGCDNTIEKDLQSQWIQNAIPQNEKCFMYQRKPSENFSCLSNDSFIVDKKVPCDKYVFEKQGTFIEEVNIACTNWKRVLLGTLRGIAALISYPVVGYCSDRWGRKLVIIVIGVCDGIFGIIKALSVSYPMYATCEFIEGLFTYGVYAASFVLALEIMTPKRRTMGSSGTSIIFATGQIIMGLVAWLVPYWRVFLLILYIPSVFLFLLYWLLDESPRWLLSKHFYDRALQVISRMALLNKKQPPPLLMEPLEANSRQMSKESLDKTDDSSDKTNKISKYPMKEIWNSKILTWRLINCSIWWFCCIFCVHGLSINSVSLSDNKHLGFLLSAIVEIPGHISGYLGVTYFGRKRTIMTGFVITGVCLLSFGFAPKELVWLSMTAYLIGKFSIIMAIGSIYLYTSELFPTPLRLSTFTICSMFGRIGNVLAPQTPLLVVYSKAVPAVLFAVAALISAILLIWSPETLGTRLPETVEEAEHTENLKVAEVTKL